MHSLLPIHLEKMGSPSDMWSADQETRDRQFQSRRQPRSLCLYEQGVKCYICEFHSLTEWHRMYHGTAAKFSDFLEVDVESSLLVNYLYAYFCIRRLLII